MRVKQDDVYVRPVTEKVDLNMPFFISTVSKLSVWEKH